MIDTQGRQELVKWLGGSGGVKRSQAQLARLCGVSAVAVHAWIAGKARPEAHMRRALERVAGVDALSWDTDSERAAVETIVDRLRSAAAEAA
jgi:transcriptional regulator with XRE-family HTH domain